MTIGPTLDFPDDTGLAHAYFVEAARHLEDARLMHEGNRYAGAITSTLKAIELGLKSMLILQGVAGWIDLNRHEVMTKIVAEHPLFRRLRDTLTTYDPTLIGEIKTIEKLVPEKQDINKLEFDVATNTEYPFFARNSTPPPDYALFLPGAYFTEPTSKRHFRTARRLLTALQTLFPNIAAWNITLSPDLIP